MVLRMMEERRQKPEEKARVYIVALQEIANDGGVGEEDLIACCVKGLRCAQFNRSAFITVRTVDDLKHAATELEELARQRFPPSNPNNQMQRRAPINQAPTNQRPVELRCYNCQGKGHRAQDCVMPRKVPGACFTCQKTGHSFRNCPQGKPQEATKQVAVIHDRLDPDNEDDAAFMKQFEDSLKEIESVSASFSRDHLMCAKFTNLLALYDTGSPRNFIRRSNVPDGLCGNTLKETEFSGLGNVKIFTFGQIRFNLKIRNRLREISAFVVPDETLHVQLLLGRDCLRAFNIKLHMDLETKLQRLLEKTKLAYAKLLKNEQIDASARNKAVSENKIDQGNYCKQMLGVLPNKPLNTEVNERVCPIICTRELSPEQLIIVNAEAVDMGTEVNHIENGGLTTITDEIDDVCYTDGGFEFAVYPVIEQVDYNINKKLSEDDQRALRQIIVDNYVKREQIPAIAHDYSMILTLTNKSPFYCLPKQCSPAEKDLIRATVDELLEKRIIRPSFSPFASRIVMADKKNTLEKRMCIDYRILNSRTERDNFPIPVINDCLEYLEGKRFFTSLDLRTSFHQVNMAEDSVKYTAFVSPFGCYEYVKMPFGLKNAPSVFQRFINHILRDFINDKEIVVYLDDILLATQDVQGHLDLLKRVLYRLSEYRLEIIWSKCEICQTRIEYLGYLIDQRGIQPNDSHIRAIKTYPQPKNTRQVHSCVGLFSYFRRFIPSFAQLARPLYNLLKKDAVFNFDQKCVQAFETLKAKLTASPVLAIYSRDKETELHTDASSHGYGAGLLQKQNDGQFHPVAYFSKCTTPAEASKHSFELEALAVAAAVRRFELQLTGIPFKIVTDCDAVTAAWRKKDLNKKIGRWVAEMEDHNYELVWRKGERMAHVDALSRCHTVAVVNADEINLKLSVAQARDPIITELRNRLTEEEVDNYQLKNGMVYRVQNGKQMFYVPEEMVTNIIRDKHEKFGHMGACKTLAQIRLHYWFPAMREKIDAYLKTCVKCLMYATPNINRHRSLHSIEKKPIPFDTIHIDHFGPLPSLKSQRKHILVVVDAFTKFVKLYAVKSVGTKEVKCALDRYFEAYSRPSRIISDRGTAFTSHEFADFLNDRNITHVQIASASPQANSQVERVNRTLVGMLGKLANPIDHADWAKMLPKIEFAINNSIHSVTKFSPCQLLFGTNQKGEEMDLLGSVTSYSR